MHGSRLRGRDDNFPSHFDDWYSKDELAAMVPEVKAIADRASKVQVLFNTNMEDQGQVNARLMSQLLREG